MDSVSQIQSTLFEIEAREREEETVGTNLVATLIALTRAVLLVADKVEAAGGRQSGRPDLYPRYTKP